MKNVNGMKNLKQMKNVNVVLLVITMLVIGLSFINIKNVNAEEVTNTKVGSTIKENNGSNQKQELSKGEQINEKLKNLTNICKDIKNSYECAKAIENQEIKKYPELVKKRKDILELKLDNGNFKKLEDITKENFNDNTKYYFQTYITKINCYLISGNYGGGFYSADFLVKKNNGDIIMLSSSMWYKTYPVFNDDITKIFSYNCDMDGNSNGMIIYNYRNDSFTKEYETQKGIREFQIINNNLLEFKACSYSANKDEIKYLKFDGTEWSEEIDINIDNKK